MLPPAAPNPGEIYWAEDTNAVGSEQKKDRLWVIMSRRAINGNETVVVVPLTSKVKKAVQYPGFCILIPSGEVIAEYGETAPINSVALCHQVRVFDKGRFRRKYGQLSLSAVSAVQLGLSYVFNIQ